MTTIIKKKDHDNLALALRSMEKAQMLLERSRESSPVLNYSTNSAVIIERLQQCITTLKADLTQHITK